MPEHYCQNTAQSGDTTGVGLALLLHPARHLTLLVNYDDLAAALNLLLYYRGLGVGKSRLHVVICDADAKKRVERKTAKKDAGIIQNTKSENVVGSSKTLVVEGGKGAQSRARAKNEFITARKNILELDLLPAMKRRQDKRVIGGRFDDVKQVGGYRAEAIRQPMERRMAELSNDVRIWDDPSTILGCNQVYQTLSNPDETPPLNYQQFFDTANNSYLPIGTTTQDLKSLIETTGTTQPIKRIHTVFGSNPISEIDKYAQGFLTNLFGPKPLRELPIEKRPVLVLIWIRGLSTGELNSFKSSPFKPNQVDDAQLLTLEKFKKNPHHVMTVQLYTTILQILRELTEGTGRRYVGVPIGDKVLYDQYSDPTNENTFLGTSDDNLIGFFGKCKSFKEVVGNVTIAHRYNQLYFIYKLFQSTQCQLMQIGIRSGAMEGGMYMGAPTIYIEEKFSRSGPRMAQLTHDGDLHALLDKLFLEARSAVGSDTESLKQLERFREIIQDTLLPTSINNLPDRYVDALFDMWSTSGHSSDIDTLKQKVRQIATAVKLRTSSTKGFPFFFRLVVQNLIGLNQMRSHQSVEEVLEAITTRSLNAEPRLLRGTLTRNECNYLRSLLHLCAEGNQAFSKDLKSWTPKPLKSTIDYLPDVD